MPSWQFNSTVTRCSRPTLARGAIAAVCIAFQLSVADIINADSAEPAKPATEPPAAARTTTTQGPISVSAQYCASILDRAADARFAEQRAQLAKLQKQIEERLGQLEQRRVEVETWTKRREDFLAMVRGNLSTIYSKMKPAAAAEQLAKIDDMTAAAILLKLDPRATSAILTEMDPAKAAELARLFAAAERTKTGKGT